MSRVSELCAACKRGACEDCYAVDHPDMPNLYACLCQERGKWCPRPSEAVPDPDVDLYLALLDHDDTTQEPPR